MYKVIKNGKNSLKIMYRKLKTIKIYEKLRRLCDFVKGEVNRGTKIKQIKEEVI